MVVDIGVGILALLIASNRKLLANTPNQTWWCCQWLFPIQRGVPGSTINPFAARNDWPTGLKVFTFLYTTYNFATSYFSRQFYRALRPGSNKRVTFPSKWDQPQLFSCNIGLTIKGFINGKFFLVGLRGLARVGIFSRVARWRGWIIWIQ